MLKWMVSVLMMTLVLKFGKTEDNESTATFWKNIGMDELKTALGTEALNRNVAKNVIIFLGDGMSLSTVTAARILKGQLRGERGEETKLTMDSFPHVALSRTYSVDRQVADSASTATAYLCGVKTNYYMLGLTAAATRGDCRSSKGSEKRVDSVLVEAWKQNKSAGIVTTTRINHATPGAAYAHTPERTWYSDADLTFEAQINGCKDIAEQFIASSHMFEVVLGGGRKYFLPNTTNDVEYKNESNSRLDGQNLIQKWIEIQKALQKKAVYVTDKKEFDKTDPGTIDRLLGLFEPADMQYEAHRVAGGRPNEPSIAEMTEKAIQMLRKNSNGYILLVEGGRIDHAHHAGNAHLALHDTVAFDNAVAKALTMTSDRDTLIIVTADHGHTLSMGGYSFRGNDIFGFAPSDNEIRLADDGKPFTTLLYANGPGYKLDGPWECPHNRENLTYVDTRGPGYLQQAAVPLSDETHGGEDVGIFARGPMSHLFHGVHEQNYIATVIRFVSCVGLAKEHCHRGEERTASQTSSGNIFTIAFFVTLAVAVVLICVVAALNIRIQNLKKTASKTSVKYDGEISTYAAQEQTTMLHYA